MKKDAAVFLLLLHFWAFIVSCFVLFFVLMLYFPLLLALFSCFLFRLLFSDQNLSFFLTQNALERTVQPQFAYSGPQGTAKPFMCEYLTNQQITG